MSSAEQKQDRQEPAGILAESEQLQETRDGLTWK